MANPNSDLLRCARCDSKLLPLRIASHCKLCKECAAKQYLGLSLSIVDNYPKYRYVRKSL